MLLGPILILPYRRLGLTTSQQHFVDKCTRTHRPLHAPLPFLVVPTPQENSISPRAVYNFCAGEWSSGLATSLRADVTMAVKPTPPVGSVPYPVTPRSYRFNLVAAPTTPRPRYEEDDDFQPAASSSNTTDARCETIRKRRIESEQRHRNGLRYGYHHLKFCTNFANERLHHFIRRCRCEWSRGTCVPGEFRTTLDTLFDTGRRYIFCINPNDTRLPNPLERRWFRDNQTPSIAMSGIDGADLPCNWSARHIVHGVSQRRIQIDLVSGDIDHSS